MSGQTESCLKCGRFEWSQKMPSLVHSTIMTCVGLIIVSRRDWQSPTIATDKDELVRGRLLLGVRCASVAQL